MNDVLLSATERQIAPTVLAEIESSYYNVKTYGAVGDGQSDDTEAIRAAIRAAYTKSGTVYFPKGTYLLSDTIEVQKNDARKLTFKGDGESVIIGSEFLDGDLFSIKMKYHFQMMDLQLEHRGPGGSVINAVYLRAFRCQFRSNSGNSSSLVEFHGSDCKIDSCQFETSHPDSYAIYYSMLDQEISINDYIVDNRFTGSGRGILVGDGQYTGSGRCEGLKINGNTFDNTGDSQIVIQEILHVDIACNKMQGSTGSAVVLRQKGYGPDGVFINQNEITAAFACIRTEGTQEDYLSMAAISNNRLTGGQYGFYDPVGVNKGFLRENRFQGQSVAGVFLQETRHMMILLNWFQEDSEVRCLDVTGSGYTVIRNNETNGNNRLNLTGETVLSDIRSE